MPVTKANAYEIGCKGGRPPGSNRNSSANLKDGVLRAWRKRGGVEYLQSLPTKEFVSLLLRCLPTETKTDITVTTLEQLVAGATKKARPPKGTRELPEGIPDASGSIADVSGN